MSIEVLSCNLKLKKTLDQAEERFDELDYLMLSSDSHEVDCIKFIEINKERLVSQITNLSSRSKNTTGSSLTGKIVFVYKGTEEPTTGMIKVTSKGCEEISCPIKVMPLVKDKKNKETLTMEQKIELLESFVNKHKRTPNYNEEYKGFNIGRFYKTIDKQKELVKRIESIIKQVSSDE